MKLTSKSRIALRIRTGHGLDIWKRKIHKLRAIVAGDVSSIDEYSSPQPDSEAENLKNRKKHRISGLYDILVREFEEGTSNKVLKSVKTLLMQCSFKYPEIDFDGVDPIESTINSLYLSRRFGWTTAGCNADHHMKMALLDYLISGIGWVWCGVEDGKPRVRFVDNLDIVYDQDADIITDIKWCAVYVTERLGDWVEMFGESSFKDEIAKHGEIWEDVPVQLCYYWDVDGEFGTHAILKVTGVHSVDAEDFVVHEENPHYCRTDIIEKPFLPLDPIYFMILPQVRNPVSIVEMMLPSQLATRGAEQMIRRIISSGAGWLEVEAGAYDPDDLERLESGEEGVIITRNEGKPPMVRVDPTDIPSGLIQFLQYHDNELTTHGGADPYSTGGKVDGIRFASEVNAIRNNAGLTASTATSDHAAHWSRVAAKTLANAANYDEMPLVLRYDSLDLEFGPQNPIGAYLRPDAAPMVNEDSLRYRSREERIAMASQKLKVAMTMSAFFPNAPKVAYEDYLLSVGEKDLSRYMEQPMMTPQVNQTGDEEAVEAKVAQ